MAFYPSDACRRLASRVGSRAEGVCSSMLNLSDGTCHDGYPTFSVGTGMRHGSFIFVIAHSDPISGATKIRFLRSVWRIGIAAAAGFLAACGTHGGSITVDHETLFPDVKPRVDAIARTRDGGFVVTGIGLAAWVVATDREGNVLWQYKDPVDDLNHTISQSVPQTEFHGAVPMANGSTLLCGTKYKSGDTDNLLVILDSHGKVVEKRVEVPNGDSSLVYSGFYQCFPWRDGIVLIGSANDRTHGYVWLVALDGNGAKRGQALMDNVQPAARGTIANPSFVFTAWNSPDDFRVIRSNEKGETIAKRIIAGEFIVQLRPVVESEKTWILIYRAGKATVYVLDERLQDVQPPKQIQGHFDPQAGRGYVLADGSMVLFGRNSNAAITLISNQGKPLAIREFNSKYSSFSVSDAVPVSADEFVTVRGSVSQDPKDQGLVMSWVTIKVNN
jgi:hypothetical protein